MSDKNEKKDNKDINEKKKALEAALGQIEKQFGKGSVMKLRRRCTLKYRCNSNRCIKLRYCTWHWWSTKRKNYRSFWT